MLFLSLPISMLTYFKNSFVSKKKIAWLIKGMLLFLLCFVLFQKLSSGDWTSYWAHFYSAYFSPVYLIAAICLMPFNLGLEAFKWRQLVRSLERVGMFKALQAICAGTSFAMFTPNRLGEFGGRIVFLQKENRSQGTVATLVGSLSQIVASFGIGLLGFIFFASKYQPAEPLLLWIIGVLSLLLFGGMLFFYFNVYLLENLIGGIPFLYKRIVKHLEPLSSYSNKELMTVLTLSASRYVLFCFQQWLIFCALGIDIGWVECLPLIFSIFFIQTVVPSVAILELGIRGNVALFIMGFMTSQSTAILTGTFALWGINLMLPAMLGAIFISIKKDLI